MDHLLGWYHPLLSPVLMVLCCDVRDLSGYFRTSTLSIFVLYKPFFFFLGVVRDRFGSLKLYALTCWMDMHFGTFQNEMVIEDQQYGTGEV